MNRHPRLLPTLDGTACRCDVFLGCGTSQTRDVTGTFRFPPLEQDKNLCPVGTPRGHRHRRHESLWGQMGLDPQTCGSRPEAAHQRGRRDQLTSEHTSPRTKTGLFLSRLGMSNLTQFATSGKCLGPFAI